MVAADTFPVVGGNEAVSDDNVDEVTEVLISPASVMCIYRK